MKTMPFVPNQAPLSEENNSLAVDAVVSFVSGPLSKEAEVFLMTAIFLAARHEARGWAFAVTSPDAGLLFQGDGDSVWVKKELVPVFGEIRAMFSASIQEMTQELLAAFADGARQAAEAGGQAAGGEAEQAAGTEPGQAEATAGPSGEQAAAEGVSVETTDAAPAAEEPAEMPAAIAEESAPAPGSVDYAIPARARLVPLESITFSETSKS